MGAASRPPPRSRALAGEEIVPLAPELARGVVSLAGEIWSGDRRRDLRYLRWKYGENPCRVAVSGGEVIGLRGAFGLDWVKGDRRARCYSASDAIVREDHRRRGVFTRMTASLLSSFGGRAPAFINLSSYVTSAAGYLALGWRRVGSWQVAHRWLSPRRRDTLGPGEGGEPTPFAVLDRRGDRLRGLTLTRRPRPAVMARVAARGEDRDKLRPLRDARFFAWRYRSPLSQYRFLFLGDRGYIALQFSIRRSRARINVVELEAPRPEDKAVLLEAAMEHGDFASLAVWSAGPSAEERALFSSLGFSILDHESAGGAGLYVPPILVRPGADFLRRIPPLSEWSLPGIASDEL